MKVNSLKVKYIFHGSCIGGLNMKGKFLNKYKQHYEKQVALREGHIRESEGKRKNLRR
jgi:hypothetical protein